MSILLLKKDLEKVKKLIKQGFTDPIPSGSLLEFIINGSKLVRSTLAILYLKSQNIEINEEIYKILATGEIIHNASLLHDDVIDDANLRRGQVTISKKYSPKVSILAGDYLLSNAIEKLIELKDFNVLEVFKTSTKKMAEAELKQYFLRDKIPTEQEYIEICIGKTASLFSVVLETCANISDLNTNNAKVFAERFGLCFQIKNDLEKDSAELDIKNNIYTAKDVLGIEKTRVLLDNYKEEMHSLIRNFPENIYKESLKDLIESL